ncbi:hypothetical protein HWC53_gp033 [Bacillus phage vB_BmeM-Goe8]|uniref:Uncharacterized protein n=1 Tax=Bacillus phage vB_BmeM-Goe8 TaxID=2593638 RepID=A0A516KMJ9_9CAUD|nr:hypothetical protein HWC53_gp033 [Bacillus phage vB_BmeM-Goe8]QDP42817.1 hypothetical protein Goe8_c00330 [Bacillus phage vB_BmeM-Goe8]
MFKHKYLDSSFTELVPGSTNEQTVREFIRETEEAFGLGQKEINALNEEQLNHYIDFLDELWLK